MSPGVRRGAETDIRPAGVDRFVSLGSEPFGLGLGDEETLAVYRGGELTLTNRRVIHRRRGRNALEMSLDLGRVEAVGFVRRLGFRWWPLLIPAIIVALGFWGAMVNDEGDILLAALFVAPFFLPLVFVAPLTVLRIATPAHHVSVRVPRARRQEAAAFLHQVITARFARGLEGAVAAAGTPTTEPYPR